MRMERRAENLLRIYIPGQALEGDPLYGTDERGRGQEWHLSLIFEQER